MGLDAKVNRTCQPIQKNNFPRFDFDSTSIRSQNIYSFHTLFSRPVYIQLLDFSKTIEQLLLQYLPIYSKQMDTLLYIPLTQGGLGLPQLTIQVQGRRASYIHDMIINSKNNHPLYSILHIDAPNLMNKIVEQAFTFPVLEQEIEMFLAENSHSLQEMTNSEIYDIPGKLTHQSMITTTPYHTMFYPTTQLKFIHTITRNITKYRQNNPQDKTIMFNLSYYARKINTKKERDKIIQEFNNGTRTVEVE